MARSTLLFVGGLLALLAAYAFKHVLIAPPAVPESAAPEEFDANRAFARLVRILDGAPPHSIDTPGSDVVRDRILTEMRAVGLQPRVSDGMTCNGFPRASSINCGRVRNLAATIGPADGEHLLIVAHYDSVPVGVGASDDGIGVATMLEIAEQLRGRELSRPITFLFNEGEENGLLGARAFLEQDPAAPRVSHLLNVESRGTDGPAIMFETSRPNGAAVDLYRRAVDRPVTNSLSTDLYRLLPNSTDVEVFEERPWTILNVAIIGNEARYHTAGDDLGALDRRSLQHMGGQALQLATAYASGVVPGASGELVYGDLVTRYLVAMPLIVALALLGVIVLLLGYAVVCRAAYGRSLLACLAAFAGAAILGWLLTSGIHFLRPGDYWRAFPLANHLALAATALLSGVIALALARRASRDQLRAASWFLYASLGAAICLIAPGAAIYFLFAPTILLAGILIERWRPGAEGVAAWIAAAVQLLTLFPVLALMELLLSTEPGWSIAPLILLAVLPFLIELQPEDGVGRPASLSGLAIAVAAWAAVLLVPAYSQDRQRIFTIEYVRDTGAGTARWGVYDDGAALPDAYGQLGEWTRSSVAYARRQRWVSDATVVAEPTPGLTKLGERSTEGGRLVRFRLAMNGWDGVSLNVPAAADLKSMTLNGTTRPFPGGGADGDFNLRCSGRSCDGLTFELLVGNAQPVQATLIGNVARLPAIARPLVEARPELARPQYVPDASYALTPIGI